MPGNYSKSSKNVLLQVFCRIWHLPHPGSHLEWSLEGVEGINDGRNRKIDEEDSCRQKNDGHEQNGSTATGEMGEAVDPIQAMRPVVEGTGGDSSNHCVRRGSIVWVMYANCCYVVV